jgi:membrane fusion protein, multidrug efflux system
VGGLVSKSSPTPLTAIVPLDPIWVRFKVSEAEHLASESRKHGKTISQVPLELILADGITHPYPGYIQNTVNQVDQKTGTLEFQSTFPNPKHNILPGEYGRVRFRKEERLGALVVPQRAIQDTQGLQSVFLVGPDNKVVAQNVVTGERIADQWVVNQGLKPGDRVIVEGTMKVRPGAPVTPQPWTPPPPSPDSK